MLKKLDSLGLAQKTVVIYASDQGMSDRGSPHGANRMTLAHDPAQHVPFMVRMPGAKPRITHRLAGMVDFFPTVLDLCEIGSPHACDGLSLRPLLEGNDAGYPSDHDLLRDPRFRRLYGLTHLRVENGRYAPVFARVTAP